MSEQHKTNKSFVIIFLCVILIILNVENLKNLRKNEFVSLNNYVTKKDDSVIQKKTKNESPKQIYFCKTHKTGGSTLQNIIFR